MNNWQNASAWVFIAILFPILQACETRSYVLADRAFDQGRYGEAEKLIAPAEEVKNDRVYSVLEKLADVYRIAEPPLWTGSTRKAGPDPVKSLYWLQKVVNNPVHRELSHPGRAEHKIGIQYLNGEGTPIDLDKGCSWLDKSYRLAMSDDEDRYGMSSDQGTAALKALAKSCASKTNIVEAKDPLFLQWVNEYPIGCNDGRRAQYAKEFIRHMREQQCATGSSISFEQYRRAQRDVPRMGRSVPKEPGN